MTRWRPANKLRCHENVSPSVNQTGRHMLDPSACPEWPVCSSCVHQSWRVGEEWLRATLASMAGPLPTACSSSRWRTNPWLQEIRLLNRKMGSSTYLCKHTQSIERSGLPGPVLEAARDPRRLRHQDMGGVERG